MTARPHQDGDYLVDSNACWIWQKGLSIQAKIAEEFGVNQSLVCRIKQRKIWRMIDEHDRSESLVEHPVVQPWEDLGQMLRPGHKVNAERPPEAPLAEHLAARRALAVEVAKVAHAVIVACDQHPAPCEAERARDPLSRVIEGGQDDREAAA